MTATDFDTVTTCQNPIFIIGSPRSGTTILALALSQHSHLWYSSESHLFPLLFEPSRLDDLFVAQQREKSWLWKEGVSRQEFLESCALGINALFSSRSQGKRWIEKTPQNTPMVNTLADMLPRAQFVHALRDGRAVVNSMVHMRSPPLWARDFRLACRAWREYTRAAVEFEKLQPKRCLTVRLEHVAADPAASFDKIFRFLGAPLESEPARYFSSHRVNSSFGGDQETAESSSKAPDPWRRWPPEKKRIFIDEAGSDMIDFGIIDRAELGQMQCDTSK